MATCSNPNDIFLLVLPTNSTVFVLFNSIDIAGPIPTEFGLMTKLEKLLVYNTGLTGSIPSELGLLINASELLFSI
jgi:hypothetical protein